MPILWGKEIFLWLQLVVEIPLVPYYKWGILHQDNGIGLTHYDYSL
jgi:hypothetical protein